MTYEVLRAKNMIGLFETSPFTHSETRHADCRRAVRRILINNFSRCCRGWKPWTALVVFSSRPGQAVCRDRRVPHTSSIEIDIIFRRSPPLFGPQWHPCVSQHQTYPWVAENLLAGTATCYLHGRRCTECRINRNTPSIDDHQIRLRSYIRSSDRPAYAIVWGTGGVWLLIQ